MRSPYYCLLLVAALMASAPRPSQCAPQLLETVDDAAYGAPAATKEDDRSQVCSDYEDDGYECVPYDLCFDGEIVVDGGGVIDIRYCHSLRG